MQTSSFHRLRACISLARWIRSVGRRSSATMFTSPDLNNYGRLAENRMRNKIASTFRFATTCVLSLVFLTGGAAAGREYWVSTTGNDADPGTKDKPFATLERASGALREAKKLGPLETGATVWLSGGVYRIDKTFALDAQDSSTAETPVGESFHTDLPKGHTPCSFPFSYLSPNHFAGDSLERRRIAIAPPNCPGGNLLPTGILLTTILPC